MIASVGVQQKRSDKRRFQRVGVSFSGRYMLPSRREGACQILDMSPGGLSLLASERPQPGDRVVVYIDKIGRFEGVAKRLTEGGFAISVELPPARREDLADRLTWFANRELLQREADDARAHERVIPLRRRTMLTLPDGRAVVARIRDLSNSGVSLETGESAAIGAKIVVGRSPASVVRLFPGGFAAAFARPFASGELDEATTL
jgi:hypothetical protein